MRSDGTRGMVFNVQSFSIHDGPGIRTTLFLKGCPLRCPWCSNPESVSPSVQVKISAERCTGCGRCVEVCTRKALSLVEPGRVSLVRSRCDDCLECVKACEYGAVGTVGYEIDAAQAARLLLKDSAFYFNTHGGVTLSGGEPLYQHEFARRILALVHDAGIHTAIDTTGCAPWEALESVLPHTDMVLYDVKHVDAGRHRAATGMDNTLILENLQRLGGRTVIWTRTPLIPGFNDDPGVTDAIVALARDVGAQRCCFLPLHRWGEHKYERLGLVDPYGAFREFGPGELERLRERYACLNGFVTFEKS